MKPCVYINKPCVFCAYASKQIEREFVYEDDQVVAFYSKSPAALKHLLVVPRAHIGTVNDLSATHLGLLKHMEVVGKKQLDEMVGHDRTENQSLYGFHVPPFNSVDHLHLHCFVLPFLSGFKQLKYLPKTPWFCTLTDLMQKLQRN